MNTTNTERMGTMKSVTLSDIKAGIRRLTNITDKQFSTDRAYGKIKIVEVMPSGGYESAPFCPFYLSKRELFDRLDAFIDGINYARMLELNKSTK